MRKRQSVREKQSIFALMVAQLIIFAFSKGYELTLGDAWAKNGEGRKHSAKSKHYIRLAIDLNLFKDGKFLRKTEDHKELGAFWVSLGGIWGGDWKDGNHYEL
ncbi:MAG: M15 family peptidase [Desulfobacteraceae bacterium]|nr:MAG: M15 family peptidase [Desulfobacteraceae bacterium]